MSRAFAITIVALGLALCGCSADSSTEAPDVGDTGADTEPSGRIDQGGTTSLPDQGRTRIETSDWALGCTYDSDCMLVEEYVQCGCPTGCEKSAILHEHLSEYRDAVAAVPHCGFDATCNSVDCLEARFPVCESGSCAVSTLAECEVAGDCDEVPEWPDHAPVQCISFQCRQCYLNSGCPNDTYCDDRVCVARTPCDTADECSREDGANDGCRFALCRPCERDGDCRAGEICRITSPGFGVPKRTIGCWEETLVDTACRDGSCMTECVEQEGAWVCPG